MPQLSDLVEKRKFVKKSYRPWDLSGENTVNSQQITEVIINPVPIETVVTQSLIMATEEKTQLKTDMPLKTPMVLPTEKITGNDIGNDIGNKRVTYKQHSGNIQVTSLKHSGNIEVTSRQQLDNDLDNVIDNTTNISYLTDAIKKLTGLQKKIFLYIINICSARGALDTANILSSDLANAANCAIGSAKTSLNRLIEKEVILRHKGKPCRGGHMVLGITKEIQAAAIQAQHALFNPLKLLNTDNVTGNVTGNNSAYSSSINKNITTILPELWKKINFEPLYNIGFSETQLRQLFESRATEPEIVQESINHFAFALQHNDKVKSYNEPLNVFMGVLRKGQRWHEVSYVSPKELALREILEEKRKKKEQFDAMIKELLELEFPEWKKKLTEDEIKKIVPPDILKMNVTAATHSVLRAYFTEKILLPQLEI